MSKIIMLSVGLGSSIFGFGLFMYIRKMKNKLKRRILREEK